MAKKIISNFELPEDFDAAEYLLLNPDVMKAGVDPARHYLNYGRKENRTYKKHKHAAPASEAAGMTPVSVVRQDGDKITVAESLLEAVSHKSVLTEKKRHHAIISGTGRAGTSFLVQLLTHLGVDTGYSIQDLAFQLDKHSKAGFEHDVRSDSAPYLVKNPFFCEYAEEVFQDDKIIIDHLFIPYRDIREAVLSRIRVSSEADHESKLINQIPGGLWNTKRPEEQQDILFAQLNKLLVAAAKTEVPVTLMSFPKLVEDPEYCYRKLFPLIPSVEFDCFTVKFLQVSRPEWVHKLNTDGAKTLLFKITSALRMIPGIFKSRK